MKPIFAAIALATAASAFAAPVTLTFTGNVTDNYVNNSATGQAVSGSLTLETSTFQYNNTDGMTYNYDYGYYYNSGGPCGNCGVNQSNPYQVSGQYSSGSQQFFVGGGTYYDFGEIAVYRNYGGYGLNEVVWYGNSYDANGDQRFIEIVIYDYLGANSQIFTDANGGVDLVQGVNWLASGATSFIYTYGHANGVVYNYEVSKVTTALVGNAVPEPASLALVACALIGAGYASRKRSAAC